METPKLSLSMFLDIIKSQFDDIIGYHHYLIEAEIKSIKQNRQFYYIDLVETRNGKIVESTRSNIFNSVVMTSFLREVGIWDVQELVGKKLLLYVKPTFHKTYNFSVNILKIHSDYFVGALAQNKKENIETLKSSGVFYNNHSQVIGFPEYNIAVITWSKSEWFRDFETILEESWYNYKITVFPSLVHGEKASWEVLKQLAKIHMKADKFNMVAIIRGWGASEGMNWTNDLNLSNEICNFPIPVMSAVGHTVDQSIVDMVSKYPCKTPSEWAQILIDIYEEFQDNLDSDFTYINNCIQDFSDKYKQELKFISKNLPLQITNKIRVYKQNLETLEVDRKIGYNLKLIWNNLEIIYHNILANNPDKILSKWFNLVYDQYGKIAKDLTVWQEYIMQTKDHEYLIDIKSKK